MPETPLIPLAQIQDTLSLLLCFEAPEGVNYEIITRAAGQDFEVRVKLWALDDDIHVYRITEPPGVKVLNALIREADRILEAAWNAPAVSSLGGNGPGTPQVVKALDVTRMGKDQ